ncbi:MAG: PIN domain-containing protein [Pseudomonadota bacterium]|nr:PIN domain-containing protein [Pseudomonadota bacterium]
MLDTNVLVAAARSAEGAAAAVLRALWLERYRLLLSVPMALEYEAVLKRPEHLGTRNPAQIDALVNRLCAMSIPVERHTRWRPQLRDPADEMVLETALNGAAHALVSFNVRDFQPAATHFRLRVCAPFEFLQLLNQQEMSHG